MTDYIACGKVVPERIAESWAASPRAARLAGCALVGGETAEHPGHGRPTNTTSRAPARAWWRPTTCSAPTACARATWSSRWPPRACTPTATRWSATSCSELAGCRSTPTSPSWAGRWARSCSTPPGSTPWTAWSWPARRRPRLRPHHRRRPGGQPVPFAPDAPGRAAGPLVLDPAAGLRPARGARPVAQADMDRTFNLGVGHGRRSSRGRGGRRPSPCSRSAIYPAWVLGEIVQAPARRVSAEPATATVMRDRPLHSQADRNGSRNAPFADPVRPAVPVNGGRGPDRYG